MKQRIDFSERYKPLSIDMTAVRSFFKKFRSVVDDETAFWDAIEAMSETIVHEYEMNEFD